MSSTMSCRSHLGLHESVDNFRLHAYASCFNFLFYQLSPRVNLSESRPVVEFFFNKQNIRLDSWDYRNESVQTNVCSFLSNDECQRWTLCCAAADTCCERQLGLPPEVNGTCGRVWDGWLCWDDGNTGTLSYNLCPLFVQYVMPSRKFVRFTPFHKRRWNIICHAIPQI